MKFAKWIFLIAGILGLLSTIPLVFAEKVMGVKQPEFYYGFVCLDVCWQILYLFLSLPMATAWKRRFAFALFTPRRRSKTKFEKPFLIISSGAGN